MAKASRPQQPFAVLVALWGLFCTTFVVSLVVIGYMCAWLGSHHAYGMHTHGQVAMAVASCILSAAWAGVELTALVAAVLTRANVLFDGFQKVTTIEDGKEAAEGGKGAAVKDAAQALPYGLPFELVDSAIPFGKWLQTLRYTAECVLIVAFVYLCDRTEFVKKGAKLKSLSVFWGVYGVIVFAALCTIKKLKDNKPMQRQQTDEWKGWMQINFVLYHYFHAAEVYNAIRIYIAAYVWMTGYGNYSLYVKGKSFTIRRSMQMMFRLNFMGFVICVALNNEYMLYYICPMHTLFTVFVILILYCRQEINKSACKMYIKIVLTFVMIVGLYDGPDVIFRAVFDTLPVFKGLFAFHDPLHPEFTNEMHEWHFRSGLDRFVWIVGMMYALHFQHFEAAIMRMSQMAMCRRSLCQLLALTAALGLGGAWYWNVFRLGKYEYNVVHPFTSWIPITVYLFLRNFTDGLRTRYMGLFAYLGKYTLETYILQFHIWMKTTGVNGSPKEILVWLPEWVPAHFWANFVLASAIYLFLSVRFSTVTMALRDATIVECPRRLYIIWACLVAFAFMSWLLAGLFVGSSPIVSMLP